MKIMLITSLVIITITLVTIKLRAKIAEYPKLEEVNEEHLLKAIELAENSYGKTGKRGEYGIYQIHPATWREHTNIPMFMASEKTQYLVALSILRHYAQVIEQKGDVVNTYSLAIAWCAGPHVNRVNSHAADYGFRVMNLYRVIK
jgi:hypothetical protein